MSLTNFATFDKGWIHKGGVAHVVKVESKKEEIALVESSESQLNVERWGLNRLEIGNSASKEIIIAYVRSLWGEDAERMLEIFWCESGFKEKVISRTMDVGVAQINLAAHWSKIKGATRAEKIANLQEYKYNLDFAFALWKEQGVNPWVCSRIKNYKL